MANQTSKLIILSAPSGGGKSTLCKKLLKTFPTQLELSISATSRAPRGHEQEGVHYYFVSEEVFKERIKNHAFAEWALVHGNYYGTQKKDLDSILSKGKYPLLDIDIQGARSLAQSYPKQAVRIFIHPPNMATLEARLRGRKTDSETVIQKRLKQAQKEMAASSEFDYCIVNDQLEKAFQKLKLYIHKLLEEA